MERGGGREGGSERGREGGREGGARDETDTVVKCANYGDL